MPGMRVLPRVESNASPANLAPGREVLYLGNLAGGPHHGARGVVRRIYGRKAVVDMGRSGTWHIPYFFLAVPSKAA